MLTKEQILSNVKLKQETVFVPEWSGDVIVSEMSGTSRDAWEQSIREKDAQGRFVSTRAKLILFTVVTETGERLFKDEDLPEIGKLSSFVLEKVCTVAMKLNGLGSEAGEVSKKN